MTIQQKLGHELKAVVLVTLFFAVWLGILMVLKILILEDYQISFGGYSKVLIGAMVLAKVVLILEHVSLGQWSRNQPVLVNVVLRTLLYAFGTFGVLVLEKAFESRHEQGGIGAALGAVLQHPDMPHVWSNTICLGAALFFFNLLSAINAQLEEGGLTRLILSPQQDPKSR